MSDIATRLAQSGGRELSNPVIRFALGLPDSNPGSALASLYKPPQAPQGPQQQSQGVSPALQSAIMKRLKFADEVGYARPGQGMLTGAALRPEVRQWGDEYGGGIVAVDLSDITPEEERALRMMIDPSWWQRQNNG